MVEFSSLLQIVAAAALGFLYLLAGDRWARVLMKGECAVLFAALGTLACKDSVGWIEIIIIAGALGVIGWKLGNAYYFLHVVLLGAIVGVCTAWGIYGRLEWGPSLVGGVVGIILTIRIQRPALIFLTSALGAFLLAASASAWTMTRESWVLCAVLTVLGTIYQIQTTRRPVERRDLTTPRR
jgi:hypothetical protein